MTDAQQSPLSEREAFENGYFYFVRALKVLSMPPDEQCEWIERDVAWNLKDEVGAAKYLLQSPSSGRLSAVQRRALEALLQVLDAVPAKDLPGGFGRHSNLEAMNHPSWQLLRASAADLVELLRPATEENDRYFAGLGDR